MLCADSMADFTDAKLIKKGFNGALFPGMNSDAQGHGGFLEEHSKTADTILSEVKKLISSKGATTVMAVCISGFWPARNVSIKF